MSKEVKVLIFPEQDGKYPDVTKDKITKVIDLEKFGDGEHFSVARVTFLENKKSSLIEAAERKNLTTNLFLWNQPQQEELERIINYPMPENVRLFHVDHSKTIEIPEKEEKDPYIERLELLSQKKR